MKVEKGIKEKIREMIDWCNNRRKDNTIFRQGADKNNEDVIDKLTEILDEDIKYCSCGNQLMSDEELREKICRECK